MCLKPITVQVRGIAQQIACRQCRQCRDNRIRDWVGRCIAEDQYSVHTTFMTLTYGFDETFGVRTEDPASFILIYKDVQDWLKRLRKAGHPMRYILCGEYGSRKGRSHWHAIMFWTKKPPNYMLDRPEFEDKFWPHGLTYTKEFHENSAQYVCKYVMKDQDDPTAQSEFHMSTKPPIGAQYFQRLAQEYARQMVLPKDPGYSFPHVRVKKTGLPRKFMMSGATLDLFVRTFVAAWDDFYGSHPLDNQHSEWLSLHLDKLAPRIQAELTPENQGLGAGGRFKGFVRKPWIDPPGDSKAFFLEPANSWIAEYQGRRYFWSYDSEGMRSWEDVVRTETQARALREEFVRRNSPEEYRKLSRGE